MLQFLCLSSICTTAVLNANDFYQGQSPYFNESIEIDKEEYSFDKQSFDEIAEFIKYEDEGLRNDH